MRQMLKTALGMALAVVMTLSVTSVANADTSTSIEITGRVINMGGQETTYKISYDANGGTGSFTGPAVTVGGTDIIAAVTDTGITRDGYKFTIWNTQADGSGTNYTPGDSITINDDVTLYAQWSEVTAVTPVIKTITKTITGGLTTTSQTAKTGDVAKINLWSTILIVSLGLITHRLWKTRRKRKNKTQEP